MSSSRLTPFSLVKELVSCSRRVERNYCRFGYRFSLRKVVIGEVIGQKTCLTDEAIRNTMKRCDG